jgi:hypothetical protein
MVYNGNIPIHVAEISDRDFIYFGFTCRRSRHDKTLGRGKAFRELSPLYDQMAYA